MDPDQAKILGEYLRSHRQAAGLSIGELSRRVGIDRAQITRLEQGTVASPRADVLARIADTIEVSVEDLYGLAGYRTTSELPSFVPYLRAKYTELPTEAIDEMERYFRRVARKHGTAGPLDGEDE
jgi:transcriptional regulator with XRE-family HTH domain